MTTQSEKAQALRALHRRGQPLVLVNVWDAISARIVEEVGFPAVATTSAGIAWLEGYADGERISLERMLEGVARVARAVRVPVSADLEAGYGPTAEDAAATARGAIAAGAVGLNFEDWDEPRSASFAVDVQVERIEAIRAAGEAAGVPLVINARTDVFLRDVGESDDARFVDAVARGNRYLDSGATCIFVPGVSEEGIIARLVEEIRGPVSLLAGAGSPSLERLTELGVARVSVGSGSMGYALARFRELASGIKRSGEFSILKERIPHAEANALFEKP